MTKTALDVKKLSPTEQALFAYLDEMLREVTESPEAAIIEPVVEAAPVVAAPAPAVVTPGVSVPVQPPVTPGVAAEAAAPIPPPTAPAPAVTARATVKSVVEKPVNERTVIERSAIERPLIARTTIERPVREARAPAIITPAVEPEKELPADRVTASPGWADNGRPVWAQSRFDVLIFKVAGLKLAVPLVSLGLIHPIDKKFNALPHQTDWFLGLLRVQGGNIKVIDTARHVMPERYSPNCRENLKFVITLHGYEWGLACHEVEKAICLEPNAVNWRTQRSKRPWMAGTVRDHMCALIDAVGFHQVIESVERQPPE